MSTNVQYNGHDIAANPAGAVSFPAAAVPPAAGAVGVSEYGLLIVEPADPMIGPDPSADRSRSADPDGSGDADTDPDADGADDDLDDGGSLDRESIEAGPGSGPGVPVDPPDEPRVFAPAAGRGGVRAPVVPAWMASRQAAAASVRWVVREAGYRAGFHGLRAPKYAGKAALFAPVGMLRLASRLVRWAMAEEGNWALRQAAANRGDVEQWLKLDARRQRQARWRWSLLLLLAVVAVPGVLVLVYGPVPVLWRAVAVAVGVLVLARAGRPADRPITDRVTHGQTYRKLTAELVRRALLSVQLSGITSAVAKDPNAISFPVEIHRDGPGHLAIVDLPYGVEAADVIGRASCRERV